MTGRRLVAVVALACAGCTFHMRRNAPGNIDPLVPPADAARPGVEVPGDPGERMVMLTAGGYGGGGGVLAPGGDLSGMVEVGPEVGLHFADLAQSHEKPLLFPVPHVWPDESWGVNAGLSLLTRDGEELEPSRLWAEAQRAHRFWGWAVGGGVDLETGDVGPHATAWIASYYARIGFELDGELTATMGMFVKLPATWVWSR